MIEMINYWFYIFTIFIPAVVLCVRPEATTKILVSRLLMGTLIGYALILVAVYVNESHAERMMEAFYHQFPECTDQRCENTPELRINGTALGILIYLGWAVSALYVGVCECLWRLYHQKIIKNMGKTFKSKWLSNLFTGYAMLVFIVCPICMIASYIILTIFFNASL